MDNVELAVAILKNELETNSKQVWAELADFISANSDIGEHLEAMAEQSTTYDIVYDCIDYLKRTAALIESERIADNSTEQLLKNNGFFDIYE